MAPSGLAVSGRVFTRKVVILDASYSCLENPVDRGAWWGAVHGVAQSRTRLK